MFAYAEAFWAHAIPTLHFRHQRMTPKGLKNEHTYFSLIKFSLPYCTLISKIHYGNCFQKNQLKQFNPLIKKRKIVWLSIWKRKYWNKSPTYASLLDEKYFASVMYLKKFLIYWEKYRKLLSGVFASHWHKILWAHAFQFNQMIKALAL